VIHYRGITIDRDCFVIEHRGHWRRWVKPRCSMRRLRSVRFDLMCHLILAGPVSNHNMLDLLYDEDPDGGPLFSYNMLHVMYCQMRPTFRHLELQFRQDKRGGKIVSWLEPTQ